MNILQALFLGVLQGITEFLPVSSSGHLALAQYLFGFREPQLFFDVAVHVATLMAVFVVFRADLPFDVYRLPQVSQPHSIGPTIPPLLLIQVVA